MSASTNNQDDQTNYESYFGQRSSTTDTGSTDANEEAQYLFTGTLDDIDTWERIQRLKIFQKDQDSERKLREKNALKAFWFSAVWASFIAFIILMHAMCSRFNLTEVEFLSVIGALTTSILIYYLQVIKYLFYRKGQDKD